MPWGPGACGAPGSARPVGPRSLLADPRQGCATCPRRRPRSPYSAAGPAVPGRCIPRRPCAPPAVDRGYRSCARVRPSRHRVRGASGCVRRPVVAQVPRTGVAGDQLQGVEHRVVGGVVAAELQHVQQFDQPGPVVVRVRRLQRSLHRALIRRARRLEFGHQVPQHLLRRDGNTGVPDQPVPGIYGRLSHAEQQVLLAGDPPKLLDQLLGHLHLDTGVDPMHRRDQQPHQRVGDLPLPVVHSTASSVIVTSRGWSRRWDGAVPASGTLPGGVADARNQAQHCADDRGATAVRLRDADHECRASC